MENIKPDAPVEVVLDVLPGRIFPGKVQNVGWGVSQGSSIRRRDAEDRRADGARPQPAALHRQDQSGQRILPGMRYGSQANVVVYGTNNPIVNALGAVFIRLVAVLTYVS